jgi:hypothetical protein
MTSIPENPKEWNAESIPAWVGKPSSVGWLKKTNRRQQRKQRRKMRSLCFLSFLLLK